MEVDIGFIFPALIAGLLTFLAPCTFPLIPVYLGLISGSDLEDAGNASRPAEFRRRLFINSLFFILGFALVFIVLGGFAVYLGSLLGPGYRTTLTRFGGLVIILLALMLLLGDRLPWLQREWKLKLPSGLAPGKPTTAFLIGLSISLGWTPCIGPILGTIITLAASSSTLLQGLLLLVVFVIGLSIPFLLIALAFGSASRMLKRLKPYLRLLNLLGGVFLLILGILMLSDNFGLLIRYGYQLFGFLNYEALMEFM